MPTYTYECPACGKIVEGYRSIEERHSFTCECGQKMDIVILTAPSHPKEILPYYDKGLGRRVQDRSERKRIMQERGLREAGDKDDPLTKEMAEVRKADLEQNHKRR